MNSKTCITLSDTGEAGRTFAKDDELKNIFRECGLDTDDKPTWPE